jgi:hypothetical protein
MSRIGALPRLPLVVLVGVALIAVAGVSFAVARAAMSGPSPATAQPGRDLTS